ADMPDQATKETKHERARRAAQAAAEMEGRFLEECVGTVQSVLFETEENGLSRGPSMNYCEVETAGTGYRNKVKNVQIFAAKGGKLLGNVIL
ncbi:MAG: tRNA (N(6)-L-threonylcarbamoyladenosine(37)-C(2))-methylthiotransferase MtaB, partial [Oscillospiraceae bacterium]|nr:tRNA (N(6)-L-threonylcarbamoyladenosine(37)-C(2))-methylthiotransferase MtaB [Oscillospiraceae bacterium]